MAAKHNASTAGPMCQLLYHPTIPGRGEFVRLALEAAGEPYSDIANEDMAKYSQVQAATSQSGTGDEHGNPPAFAPPALKIRDGRGPGKDLVIYQTAAILSYLGQRHQLAGSEAYHVFDVQSLALTALDFTNEVHDTHHPVAVMDYYEDQMEAALTKSNNFRNHRIPKYLSLLERTLKWNEGKGHGIFTVGTSITYADTTWWQAIDGVLFAFPKEIAARRQDYSLVFDTFYPGLKDKQWLKDYLGSSRRLPYSNGVWRHYSELDRQ